MKLTKVKHENQQEKAAITAGFIHTLKVSQKRKSCCQKKGLAEEE